MACNVLNKSYKISNRALGLIPVVINMFRLPDLLTGENMMCSGRKSL
jgi:hypothetical protein